MHVAKDYLELSHRGARFMLEQLHQNPGLLLCVASGASPLGLYRNLAAHQKENPTVFAKLRVIKLDEWGPLSPEDPASCEYYIQKEIVRPLSISQERYLSMAGDAPDSEQECARCADGLGAAGPIDVCILGMGANGHLGLNEPAEWLHDTVHVAALASASFSHGMLTEARTPVTHGITLGIGDLLRSRRILLLVSGVHKREAMRQFLSRRITTQFPASILWTHRDLTVLCDRAAHTA